MLCSKGMREAAQRWKGLTLSENRVEEKDFSRGYGKKEVSSKQREQHEEKPTAPLGSSELHVW